MGQESSQLIGEEEHTLQVRSKPDLEERNQNLDLTEKAEEQPEKLEGSAGYGRKTAHTIHNMKRGVDWQGFEDSALKRQKKSKKRKRTEHAQDEELTEESLNFKPNEVTRLGPAVEAISEVSRKRKSKSRNSKKEKRLAEAIEQDFKEEISFAGQPENLQTPSQDAYSYLKTLPPKKKKRKKRPPSSEQAGAIPKTVPKIGDEVMPMDESSQITQNVLLDESPASVRSKKRRKKTRPSASFGENDDRTHKFTPPGEEPIIESPISMSKIHIRFDDNDLANPANSAPYNQHSNIEPRDLSIRDGQKQKPSKKLQTAEPIEILSEAAPKVKKQKYLGVNDDERSSYDVEPETNRLRTDLKKSQGDSNTWPPADLHSISHEMMDGEGSGYQADRASRQLPQKHQNMVRPSAHSRSPSPVIAGPSAKKTWTTDNAKSDFEGDSATKQIGVYRNSAELPTRRPPKRRLPVNDNEEDGSLTREVSIKRKPLKATSLTPKPPLSAEQPLKWQPPIKRRSSSKKRVAGTRRWANDGKTPTISGKMSEEEHNIMANEMEKFRDMYTITAYDQNQLVAGKPTKMSEELFDMLCEALPGRSRLSIMRVCRRRFHNYSARGTFTPEDDELLKEAYEQYPKSWKKIGELLNRHPEDVRDRWRNYLICGNNQKLSNWTEDEEQTLRDVVASCVESIEELKASKHYHEKYNDKPALELVDWQTVSSMMGHTRSRLQCMTKWKTLSERQMPGAEVDNTLDFQGNHWRVAKSKRKYKYMSRDDLLDLLNAIRASHAGREGKIPWKSLGSDEFKNKWPSMTRKMAWKRLRTTIEGNRTMMLQDLVKRLIDAIEAGEDINLGFEDELPQVQKKGKSTSRKSRKTPLSNEMVDANDDVGESDVEIHSPPRAKKTKRKKLTDRMVRGDESVDGLDESKSEDNFRTRTSTNGRRSTSDESVIEVVESDADDVGTTSDGQSEDEDSDLEASGHSDREEANSKLKSSPLPDEGEDTQSEDD